MAERYINYGSLDGWASTVDKRNNNLLEDLHQIQRLIKSLEGEYESNAAIVIREKIQGMEPRFQQYYAVVENYAKLLRNTAADNREIERTNTNNAERFTQS